MLLAIVVVINGAFVPSSPPARRLFGHIMAPLDPVVARIADRVTLTGDTITLVRGTRTCAFRIGSPAFQCGGRTGDAGVAAFARDGIVFVPLAAVARSFGANVAFDARGGIVSVVLPPSTAVKTPAPFDALAPQAVPTQVFTPQPSPPPRSTPQPLEFDPRPRRTAIPVNPL